LPVVIITPTFLLFKVIQVLHHSYLVADIFIDNHGRLESVLPGFVVSQDEEDLVEAVMYVPLPPHRGIDNVQSRRAVNWRNKCSLL